MIHAFGISFIIIIVFVISFYGSMRLMDHLRWWNEAGLAAFIPMLIVAVPFSLVVTGLVIWSVL